MRGEPSLLHVPRTADLPAVIACAVSFDQRVRIVDALRERASLRFLDSFRDLRESLRTAVDRIDAVVIPARDAGGTEATALVRDIARERPRTAIIAYLNAGADRSRDIRALAAAGVHQFLFAGIDDSRVTLRAIVNAARLQWAADWVMRQLARLVPAKLHPLIEMALAHPETITSVSALADAMGVRRRTLFNWCVRSSYLSPEELLVWARLALVGYYLETTGCTVEAIALELGFPSDTALRNTIKRYTGDRATELRTAGGLSAVLAALERRLQARPR
jgi:methylphosphotriester-DNA--protein-cysteine methyltransferase